MRTIARYDDIREISRDPARFCSSMGALVNDPMRTWERPTKAPSILHMDPPDHVGLPQAREPGVHAPSNRQPRAAHPRAALACVLDRTPDSGEFDFVDLVAAPFPLMVIAELLGIPDGDRPDFRRWSDATIEATDKPPEATAAATGELFTLPHGAHRGEDGEPRRRRRVAARRRRGRRPIARPRRTADLPAGPARRRQRDDAHVDLGRNARARSSTPTSAPTSSPTRRSSRARSRSACAGSRRSRRSPAP